MAALPAGALPVSVTGYHRFLCLSTRSSPRQAGRAGAGAPSGGAGALCPGLRGTERVLSAGAALRCHRRSPGQGTPGPGWRAAAAPGHSPLLPAALPRGAEDEEGEEDAPCPPRQPGWRRRLPRAAAPASPRLSALNASAAAATKAGGGCE